MNLITLSIRKPITMLMVILTLAVFGGYTYRLLSVDLMPDVSMPVATVQIIYPGAGPEDIQTSVVKKIEDQFATLNGLDEQRVTINEGFALFVVKFKLGTNIDIAAMDIKDKIDAIRMQLPSGIKDPVVQKFDFGAMPILTFALSVPQGTSMLKVRKFAEDNLSDEFSQVPGVAAVDVLGGEKREIHLNLDRDALEGRHLPLTSVFGVLSASNLNYPLGFIKGRVKKTNVRLNAEFDDLNDLRSLLIPTPTGPVRLNDLGSIEDGIEDPSQKSWLNGNPTVGMQIRKRPDANVVKTAELVLKKVKKLEPTLPKGWKIETIQNRARFAKNSVDNVFGNIYSGILLTAIVLLLFLRSWASTFIVAVTMPVSIICTFSALWASGFSVNVMSLMALGLSVGLLVTNAIVVIENITRHINEKGDDPATSSEKGTIEVAMAVAASTLTNVAVFIPIAFMNSIVGQFFKEFGLTMVYATFFSLLISFTLIPLMSSGLLKPAKVKEKTKKENKKGIMDSLEHIYTSFLDFLMHPVQAALLLLTVIALLMTVPWVASHLGKEFAPKTDEGMLKVSLQFPSGTKLDATDKISRDLAKKIEKVAGVRFVFLTSGGANPMEGGENVASILVRLQDRKNRTIPIEKALSDVRKLLVDVPDAISSVKPQTSIGDPNKKGDLSLQILGSDLGDVVAATDSIHSILDSISGIASITSSWKSGQPELVLRPNPAVLADYGLTVGQAAQMLNLYITGSDASVFRDNSDEYDILVRLSEKNRRSRSDILAMTIPTPRGMIPLGALVNAKNESGASSLNRLDKKRMITLDINVFPGTTMGDVQKILDKELKLKTLPGDAEMTYGGDAEMMAETMTEMVMAMILAVLLTYILLTALLESFVQPVVIMFTIPLGAIGVFWSLLLAGMSISMMSLMAMVMLIGIVVNNAILIMDYSNILHRHKGYSLRDSAVKGAGNKLRAVIMTNLAAITAMIPLALGIGEGAEMRQPMAVASVGGMLVSTTITIFLIPVLYWAVPSLGSKIKSIFIRN